MMVFVYSRLAPVLAQLASPGIDTPEEAALVFSGPQFFIALLSGLVLTFGFQLLLTNLSVAAGISYVGSRSNSSKSSSGVKMGTISVAVGMWTLVTVALALFFACWLAVKLSLYNSVLLGAITGLVIWGTYFALLFWVSSTTVGSLIGSVVKTATASFNSLVGTATAAFGAKSATNQVVETAEAVAATIRKELSQTLDDDSVLESLKEYVVNLQSPQIETHDLESEFERLIEESNITALADRETLDNLERSSFEKLVKRRTDLSNREVKRVANQLYMTWQRSLKKAPNREPLATLIDYVQTTRPNELTVEQISDRLDQFLNDYRRQSKGQSSALLSQGFNALMGVIMGRTDLSDLNVEKISSQVKQVKSQLVDQGHKLAQELSNSETRYSVIREDIESYLLNTYPWQLQPERLKIEFRELLYDFDADAGILRQELAPLNRAYFESVLASRGLLTREEIEQTALILESVRYQVFQEVTDIHHFETAQALLSKVEVFLKETPRSELLSEMGLRAFTALVSDSDASVEDLQNRFSELSDEKIISILRFRSDLYEADVQHVAVQCRQALNEILSKAESFQDSAKASIEHQWQKLQNYLLNTGKEELNPNGIKTDIQVLMREPDAGIHRLRQRLAKFDRDTLIQLLSQRQDLSEMDARRIARDVEDNWHRVINAPATLTAQAKAKYDSAASTLEQYLRQTGKPELNPDSIKRDLQLLMDDPKVGMQAMKGRLAQVDRDTLVQILSQRDDLSEEDVDQAIDDVLDAIRNTLKMPQRFARRAQQQALSFEYALEDYLRNTNKAELDPDGIKRDLQLLMNDPRLGSQRLTERISQIDRDSIVSLISQRQDMTQEEAELAVDRVLAVRDQILAQIHSAQKQVNDIIRGLLSRVRMYFNSLDRPELSYEGIRRDLRELFDDPQAGFESLKHRFSQFDRNTLVAVLSSHEAMSERDAQKVIDQIEGMRDSTLRKAERLEREVEARVHALKLKAQEQFEETRKAAEVAAWWIFGTATISAIASAIAGSLAVIG